MVIALAACGGDRQQPGYVFLPGMVEPVPAESFDANAVLPSGRTLQLPPEGTVPVGWLPFSYGATKEEAERAGRELTSPLATTPASLARGRRVYENVCIVCHGPKGEGDGSIIGRFPNPPSLLAPRARGLADGQIYHVITRGQGIMPSHAVQVLPADRWHVIQWLRELQRAAGAAPATPPPVAVAGAAPMPASAAVAQELRP